MFVSNNVIARIPPNDNPLNNHFSPLYFDIENPIIRDDTTPQIKEQR